jgi:DNA-binding CsgD family transcriptional regulator
MRLIALCLVGITWLPLTSFGQQPINSADSLIETLPGILEEKRGTAFIKFISPFMQKDIDLARDLVNHIDDYAKEKYDTILLISARALMAEYHWRKSEYEKGIELALESVELAASNPKFENELAKGFQTAGTIHLYLNNTDEALNYYSKAMKYFKRQENFTSLVSVYNNTGVVYMDAAKIRENEAFMDSAVVYFNKVLDIREHARRHSMLNVLGNLAGIYIERKNWERAKALYSEWEEIESEEPNKTSRAMNYGYMGIMNLELGNLDLAEKYLMEGLNYAREIDTDFEIQQYYYYLSQLHRKRSDYENALEYADKWFALKDSVYNLEKINAINELETKFQTSEKELAITRAEAEIERKERFQLFLTIVIAFLIVLFLVVVYFMRQRFKLRQVIYSQEVDNLRLQINTLLGTEGKTTIELEEVNNNLKVDLTDRELEILQLALSDLSNREIAGRISVSINTVKFHLKNIYDKLGVSNRKEAKQFVIRHT